MKTPPDALDPRDAAFLEPAAAFAGLKLRPFSAGTLTLARALKLSVVIGGGEQLDEAERQAQLVTVLYMQSAPLPDVLRAMKIARLDLQAFRDDYLLPFEMGLPIAALPGIIAELQTAFAAVMAADFDTAPGAAGSDKHPNV